MNGPAGDICWHVHPPAWDGTVPDWLAALRTFRAEVLHAEGLRPSFRGPDGSYHDEDPVDPFAHHVVATVGGALVASLRVVPLATSRDGVCERVFGTAVLEKVLAGLGVDRSQVWEGSGWAVEPGRRGAAMGARVLAAGSAVAAALGLDTAIGASGTRYGQLYRILSAGYRRAPGVAPVVAEAFADDIQLVHGKLHELRPGFQVLVAQAADLLRWIPAHPASVTSPPP